MKRVIIVHRWSSDPSSDWIPWLKAELERRGLVVVAPAMPDTDNPVIEKWVPYLAEVVGTPDKDTFLIGHSIGCQTILRYLETLDAPIGGVLFVAGWFNLENLKSTEDKELARPWIETSLNIEKVKSVLPNSIAVISDNDPYGAFEENKKKFDEIGARVVVLPMGGHICESDNPVLLSSFLELIGA